MKIALSLALLGTLAFGFAPRLRPTPGDKPTPKGKIQPTPKGKIQPTPKGKIQLDKIKLPPGFKIEVYADNVPDARSMCLSPNGTLFVGNRSEDKVYALRDTNGDFRADQTLVIASGLNMPNGVAFRDGSLYVAEVNRILRFDNMEANLTTPPKPTVVFDQYPSDKHHGWKFIAFGPDGKLYVPVGAPCNICEADSIYSSVTRLNPDGTGLEIYAKGVRNSVGLTWHPDTKELWFTSNGRDMLGDNIPPDVLNYAPRAGLNFGYPYWHAGDVKDPQFGDKFPQSKFDPPAQKLAPHTAALGLRFYTGQQFPRAYDRRLFIAEHGSWNRTAPIGYRITTVKVLNNKSVEYKTFAEGWLDPKAGAWGRPVDVQPLPDGSLLVSDDLAGAIYRISYAKKAG